MRVFVSHSRKDDSFINQHIKPILGMFFESIYILDENNTRGNIISYPELVKEGIEKCILFVVVVSKNSNTITKTNRISNEIIMAYNNNKPILVISIDDASYNDLDIHLASLSPIKLHSEPLNTNDIETQNNELIEVLKDTIKKINSKDANARKNNDQPDQLINPLPTLKTPFCKKQKLLCIILLCLLALIIAFFVYHGYPKTENISIDQTPRIDSFGGDMEMDIISGTVNIKDVEKHRIVVYAKTNFWYVQPYDTDNLHRIESSGSWQINTHLGKEYCVLLVKNDFKPISITQQFPGNSPGVICYKSVP